MKKNIVVFCIGVSAIFSFWGKVFAARAAWEDVSRGIINLNAVLVDADNPQIIYIGSNDSVFKTEDDGKKWQNVLSLKGQNRRVNFLMLDPKDSRYVYAATAQGLFYSFNQGKTWRKIFKGKDYLENDCTAIVILPKYIYLGTKKGLWISKDKGRSWYKIKGVLGHSYIAAITFYQRDAGWVYAASVDGVFKIKDGGQSWERIFISHPVEITDAREEDRDDTDEEETSSYIRYIIEDQNTQGLLYLATSKGIYKSVDGGFKWDLCPDYGLLSKDVKFLLFSPVSVLYAATKSGIFEQRDGRWYELSLGLAAQEIRSLGLDSQGNLYAACDKGLFKAQGGVYNSSEMNLKSRYSKDEPKIEDVQKAAIDYAEVNPEKIKLWRHQAGRKAFLPKVTAGVNRQTADLWHWESGSTTKVGDDTLMKGKDSVGWDVSVTWDLGEIIWNNDQTSIDVRSRLTTQLREEIIDEVTKLYFERMHAKMELDTLSIEDRKKRFEKELRLQELTAYLDGLTGGYFSGAIRAKPEIIDSDT